MTSLRLLIISALVMACNDQAPKALTDTGAIRVDSGIIQSDAGLPQPRGTIVGRIVDVNGEPMAGLELQCCTDDTCYIGLSDEEGAYRFAQLLTVPRKVRVISPFDAEIDGLFYQDVVADQVSELARSVILQPLPLTHQEWTQDTVLLGDGRLELSAPNNALQFPANRPRPVGVREVSALDLPPFDQEPWQQPNSQAIAFVFDPFHLRSSEPVSFRVLGGVEAPVGAVFSIWSIDPNKATAHRVGSATVDAQGVLSSDPGHELKELTTLILLRQN